MEIREFIVETIREYLNESNQYPFKLTKTSKAYSGVKYDIFNYSFNIDDIDFDCVIYPNLWKKDCYDVAFVTKGGTTKDRVGKDFNFMNSVLKTVAECIIDFINEKDVVKIISFDGDKIRERAYVRFFRNTPYFSKFEIDDTHNSSGFVEIHINKGI